jgi:hypothetical protein
MADKEPPKLHIDSDWKREAQAEKERLEREVEAKQAAPKAGPAGPVPGAAAAGAARPRGRQGQVPPASFSTLVQTLATQAMMFMSDEHDPQSGQSLRRLDLAKHQIDLLAVLEEKTKGNLTDEEKSLLDTALYELRMAYVSEASM